MQWKRLVYFLLLNVLVSVVTTLLILTIWDRKHRTETPGPGSPAGLASLFTPTVNPPTSTPEPTQALLAYQISAGETLGEVAYEYDISLEELLKINGLTDPDTIGAGATIFIPVPTATAAPGEASPGSASDGELGASESGGKVEILTVVGVGDLATERVQLRGTGVEDLPLAFWRLRDEDGHEYVFPQITLFGNGAVNVHTAPGDDTVVALYWDSAEAIWESGETVTLLDDAGRVQAIYLIP